MKNYRITPHDLLFFRDGRPLDRNKQDEDHRNIGHGAFWPRPDHLYNAVMHSLIGSRAAGESGEYGKFGGLQTTGPFPLKRNEDGTETLFLPRPLDWDCLLEEIPAGATDAPPFIRHGFIDRVEGKKDYPAWIPCKAYSAYLSGNSLPVLDKTSLFGVEPRVGNTLDPSTGASKRVADKNRSGQYEAQYLRLEQGVSMWSSITDADHPDATIPHVAIMGGQGLLVFVEQDSSLQKLESIFARPETLGGDGPFYVRWTLLAPALFEQTGWLPGWVDASLDGKVRLKERELPRLERECRSAWKERQKAIPELEGVHLDAAFVGKPTVFSGYDTVDGVKPTRLAVPAGSCYVFRCDSRDAANALVSLLHLTRKSDFGSQGFGIGLCSFIKPRNTNS